jgi:hypothetical protein
MPNTRQNIPLNNCVLITLWAGVEVSSEPPGVHAHRLLFLLIRVHIEGSSADASLIESFHPAEDTIPQTRMSSMGIPRIMVTSYSVTVVSPHGRWNVSVSRRHRSTSAVNAVESISGRSWVLMSLASDRNPA